MSSRAEIPASGHDENLPVILERVAAELFKLRRDLDQYEIAVLNRLISAGHDVAPELQSIDLSLQTLEEIARFIAGLSRFVDGGTLVDENADRRAFKLEGVERRLMGKSSRPEGAQKPRTIDLF